MNRRTRGLVVAAVIVAAVALSLAGAWVYTQGYSPAGGPEAHVIYVQGQMVTGYAPTGFGVASSTSISEDIQSSADSGAAAIILRINSPGGTPASAQEITRAVEYAESQGVPVVASMGDIGASAAYYAASETDAVVANPDTMTGSIGVIWLFENSTAKFRSEGTNYTIVKSGEFKDMGYPQAGLTDEEERYAQEVVDAAHSRFVTQVAEGRNMSEERVRNLADGRIYTGHRAKELGLVDRLGSLNTAVEVAEELSGEDELRTKEVNKPSLTRLLFGGGQSVDTDRSDGTPRYLEPYGKLLSHLT